jgi:hypothetical protein
MSDQEEQGPSRRGEAAWRLAKERVTERNDQARRAGKQRRQAYEREREERRRAAEVRRSAELLGRQAGR